jgi:hypothetical protein
MLERDDWSATCANDIADDLSVPHPTAEWLDAVLASDVARPPTWLRTNDDTHARSIRWLRERSLLAWFHRAPVRDGIQRVLADGRTREAIEEQLLIRGLDTAKLCLILQKKLSIAVPQEIVDMFAHYCWAVREMSMADTINWLRVDERRSSRSDVRLDYLARSPQSEEMLHGISNTIAPDAALQRVLQINLALLEDVAQRPRTPDNIVAVGTYSRTILRASQTLRENDGGKEEIARHLSGFRVKNDRKPPISLNTLKGQEDTPFNLPQIPQHTEAKKTKRKEQP